MKTVKKAKNKNNYCFFDKNRIYSKYRDWKRYRQRNRGT